jgi:DNA-binding NarL/FixJ family response regulator
VSEPVRVLICDDSLGFPTLARTWLTTDGRFEVVGMASGGQQAREMVATLRPAALVLDLVLPDVPDPPTFVHELRALHPPLRILLVSSLHQEALENAARAAGVDGVCNKAAPPAEFADRLYAAATAGSSTQNRLP